MKTITFNELRKIKDSLPDGSMHSAEPVTKPLDLVSTTVGR